VTSHTDDTDADDFVATTCDDCNAAIVERANANYVNCELGNFVYCNRCDEKHWHYANMDAYDIAYERERARGWAD